MSLNVRQLPFAYTQRLENRCTDRISLVVIHCTELPDLATARVWGERVVYPESQTGNSGHFYIDRDGSIEQWVPVNRVAHHTSGFNLQSIGVELVNNGRYPLWFHSGHQQMTEPYPAVQIESLVSLLNDLAVQLPGLVSVAGHADLDTGVQSSDDNPDIMIRRKLDPGPCFPWSVFTDAILLSRGF